MTSALVESRSWSPGRWWGLVALVFGVQLALIFWLGDTPPIRPRPAAPAFTFKLAGTNSDELLTLNNPTLFALPQRQEFSWPSTPGAPRPASPSFQWPEPTNSPLLAVGQLGSVFSQLVETDGFVSPRVAASPLPALTRPSLPPLAISMQPSTLRLEGDLARRRLVTPLHLRSCTNQEILNNSVVRIAVDAEGRPCLPMLLLESGSSEADQYALEQAKAARFEPVRSGPADPAPNAAAGLTWGKMVFQWRTVPPPPTNTPAPHT